MLPKTSVLLCLVALSLLPPSPAAAPGNSSTCVYEAGEDQGSMLQVAKLRTSVSTKNIECPKMCEAPEVDWADQSAGAASVIGGIAKSIAGEFTWGSIGGSIFDGIFGTGPSEAEWAVQKMEEFMLKNNEYLLCSINKMLGDYFQKFIEHDNFEKFEQSIRGMWDKWSQACGERKCLSLINKAGNERNDESNCCDINPGNSHSDCGIWKAKMKDIEKGKAYCKLPSSKYGGIGVCGTDRKCYACPNLESTRKLVGDTLDMFYDKDNLDGGHALDKYNSSDAVVLYSKAAAFILSLQTELVLLGEGKASNSKLKKFAEQAKNYLEPRYENLMRKDNMRWAVDHASAIDYDPKIIFGQCQIRKHYFTVKRGCEEDPVADVGFGEKIPPLGCRWGKASAWCTVRQSERGECICEQVKTCFLFAPQIPLCAESCVERVQDILREKQFKAEFERWKKVATDQFYDKMKATLSSVYDTMSALESIKNTGMLKKDWGYYVTNNFYPKLSCNNGYPARK